MSARDWFSPGQVWRPRRGRHGPRLMVVNVHRADRLVEMIDASATDRLTAKRSLLRFGELRASHRLDQTDPPQQGRASSREASPNQQVGQPPPRARRRHRQRRARVELIADVRRRLTALAVRGWTTSDSPRCGALAANRPMDPDPDPWRSRDEHAQAILRRHGVAKLTAGRLTLAAIGKLIAGQAQADRDAGLDWNTIAVPPA